jgi:hypothetical protein
VLSGKLIAIARSILDLCAVTLALGVLRPHNELAPSAIDLFNYLLLALLLPTLAVGQPLGVGIDLFPGVFCFCGTLLVHTLFIHFQRVCSRPERELGLLSLPPITLRPGRYNQKVWK